MTVVMNNGVSSSSEKNFCDCLSDVQQSFWFEDIKVKKSLGFSALSADLLVDCVSLRLSWRVYHKSGDQSGKFSGLKEKFNRV